MDRAEVLFGFSVRRRVLTSSTEDGDPEEVTPVVVLPLFLVLLDATALLDTAMLDEEDPVVVFLEQAGRRRE